MAAVQVVEGTIDTSTCGSCFASTKYICLTCTNAFCMRCSVFEEDEEKPGWKAGRSVAYCEACFREKMEKEAENELSGQESEASTSISVSSRSSGGKSLQSKAKYPRKRYVLALQVRRRCQIRGFLFYTDTVGFLVSVLICFLQSRLIFELN